MSGRELLTWVQRSSVMTADAYVTVKVVGIKVTVHYSAQLIDALNNTALGGRLIQFDANGKATCQALTGTDGKASCTGDLLGTVNTVLGMGYRAQFSGDTIYLPATATGKLAKVGPISLP